MITAMAAGTSQGGRSNAGPPPRVGGRGTVGLRTGGSDGRLGEGAGAVTSAAGTATVAMPAPSVSDGTDWPGVQAGASTGFQLGLGSSTGLTGAAGFGGSTGAGAGADAWTGGLVLKGEAAAAGAAVSHVGTKGFGSSRG